MTRVLLLPADSTGCGNYRMIWAAEVLAQRGFDVLCQQENTSVWATLDRDDQVLAAGINDDVDVVVVQRPCSRVLVDTLERISTKVVVELDDDLRCVPAHNPAFAALHPKTSPEMNWTHLDRAIRRADALVVTTPNLAKRYGQHTPTTVVPNYVPESYLKIDPPKSGGVLGWPGNVVTHPHDLQVTRNAIPQVMRATGAEFRVVGPEGAERLIPGATSTGWTDDYANEAARLDVAIAPLEDTMFNRSKSWLKPLELAALGVPVVMSPSDDYLRLFTQYGIGRMAPKPVAWRSMLSLLLRDEDQRIQVAAEQRALVRRHGLTIEDRAEEFLAAWCRG